MIEYPPELSAAARARIDRAIADAELAFIAAEDPGPQMLILGGRVPSEFRSIPAARDPVHFVLVVFETVIQTLSETSWSADQLRMTAARMLDQRIAETFLQKHPAGVTIDQFTARVHQKLQTLSWWVQFQHTIRERSLRPVSASIETPLNNANDLKTHRKTLLDEYKRVTGVKADKAIYEYRKAGIHKPEFYKWRRGELPATSQTARNFERFLMEQRPPRLAD